MVAIMSEYVLTLSDPNASLKNVGGKGISLAKLIRAGMPVPDGFHVTTDAYKLFVAENGIQPKILDVLNEVDTTNPTVIAPVSDLIGGFFAAGNIPTEIKEVVSAAYRSLQLLNMVSRQPLTMDYRISRTQSQESMVSVAVRSSATVEDLPWASFAGQQETYLNIQGIDAVLEAIKKCWASLWTARAIVYRAQRSIDPTSVALAVIVQELVFADAAGIMFTINPVNGKRDEIVINAAWGLGEAIVSGAVTPDTITLEKATGRIARRQTAEKLTMTIRAEMGTCEVSVPYSQKKKAVLTNAQAAELAKLGTDIESLYEMPMDIEWTYAAGNFAILQARPITALPEPLLEWKSSYSKPLLVRGSSIDLVPDVVSPLFATLGVPIATSVYLKMYDKVMGLRGEDVPIFEVINGYFYLCFVDGRKFWKYMLVHIFTAGKMYRYGEVRAEEVRVKSREIVTKWCEMELASMKATELLTGVRELFEVSLEYLNVSVAKPIPQSNFSEFFFSSFYNALIKHKEDPVPMTFLLGLENLPLQTEKSLYDLAQWAKGQTELADYLARTPSQKIWTELQSYPVPAPLSGEFTVRFTDYLAEVGHVIYDLDFMKPVPAEEPLPILDTLKVYLSGQGGNPHSRQQEQESQRHRAEQAIFQRIGPLRRKWFMKLLTSAQEWASKRENAIADIGVPYPQLRRLLRELGLRLSLGGAIVHPDDIYWLEVQEADALANALEKKELLSSYTECVGTRKANWKRARKATPPTILPENTFLAKLMTQKKYQTNLLKGSGTSEGIVTASACVMRGPEDFGQMHPGDVIVAVSTTPAWTPLFAIASAVVTDIGGPLSHSSIVAREYGIPAVMATSVATRRIQNGQLVTVNGTTGTVTLL